MSSFDIYLPRKLICLCSCICYGLFCFVLIWPILLFYLFVIAYFVLYCFDLFIYQLGLAIFCIFIQINLFWLILVCFSFVLSVCFGLLLFNFIHLFLDDFVLGPFLFHKEIQLKGNLSIKFFNKSVLLHTSYCVLYSITYWIHTSLTDYSSGAICVLVRICFLWNRGSYVVFCWSHTGLNWVSNWFSQTFY